MRKEGHTGRESRRLNRSLASLNSLSSARHFLQPLSRLSGWLFFFYSLFLFIGGVGGSIQLTSNYSGSNTASKSVQGAGLQPRRVGAAPKSQAANFIPFPLEKNILMAAAEPRSHAVPPTGKSNRGAAAAAALVSKTGANRSAT